MSDFDAVLERLIAESAFAAALAADPVRALAGYRLDPDEVALLHSQVTADAGGQHGVEVRANQSSLFGMLSPLAGLVGGLSGVTGLAGGAGMGQAPPVESTGVADVPDAVGPVRGPGQTGSTQGFGVPGAVQGFGPAGAAAGEQVQLAGVEDGAGAPERSGTAAVADAVRASLGGVTGGGTPGSGALTPPGTEPAVPTDYRTRVDVDGDGVWDRHLLRGRTDGGVDILVDRNRDGRVDFVGHDLDADGLVEVSGYDRDHDGFFERRMYDDNGDGWMDRSVRIPRPSAPLIDRPDTSPGS